MNNRVMITVLLTAFCVVLTGCGDKDDTDSANTAPQPQIAVVNNTTDDSSSEENSVDGFKAIEALGDVEVDKGLFDVEFTVPKDFVGDTTQEKCDEIAKEKGYHSMKLNEDGSVTYQVSRSQHKEMMQETKDSIDKSLSEMCGPDSEYPNFVEIKPNDDYTSFTVITKSDKLNLTEGVSVLGLYMYGGMYNIFNGTEVDNIHVDFVNEASGEVIDTADSKDMGN